MFDLSSSPLPVRSDLPAAFRLVWKRLAAPGTWWNAEQRVAVASVARSAYGGGDAGGSDVIPDAAVAAASLLSSQPSAVTRDLIRIWNDEGLDALRYVELIGVVSQLTAVDTFHRAMGLDLEPLPKPAAGQPTRQQPEPPPTVTKAWVPMVGPPTIPSSLSAVPAEMNALEALHGPAYLTYGEMGNPAIQKGLSRAQMELVAGRTSAINECFF